LDLGGRALLARAAERLRLSARGYHRVLRVARTLADVEGAPTVRRHLAGSTFLGRQSGLCRRRRQSNNFYLTIPQLP